MRVAAPPTPRSASSSPATATARASMLDELVRATERGPARARALVRLALVRGYDDDLRAAEALLREAIDDAEGDDELLAEAHNQLRGHPLPPARAAARGRRARDRGLRPRRGSGPPPRRSGSRLLAEAALGDPGAPSTLRRALELDARCRPRRVIARPLFQVAFAWLWWDELEPRAGGVRDAARAGRRDRRRELARLRARPRRADRVRARRRAERDPPRRRGPRADRADRARRRSAPTCSRCGRSPTRSPATLDDGRERAERALAIAAAHERPPGRALRARGARPARAVGRQAGRRWSRALGPLVDFLRAEHIIEPGTARVVPTRSRR